MFRVLAWFWLRRFILVAVAVSLGLLVATLVRGRNISEALPSILGVEWIRCSDRGRHCHVLGIPYSVSSGVQPGFVGAAARKLASCLANGGG